MTNNKLLNSLKQINNELGFHSKFNPNSYLHINKPSLSMEKEYNLPQNGYKTKILLEFAKNLIFNFAGFLFYGSEKKYSRIKNLKFDSVIISHFTNRNLISKNDPYFEPLLKILDNRKNYLIVYLNGSKYPNYVIERLMQKRGVPATQILVLPKYQSAKSLATYSARSLFSFRHYLKLFKKTDSGIGYLLAKTYVNQFSRQTLSNLSINEFLTKILMNNAITKVFCTFEGNLYEQILIFIARKKKDSRFFMYQHAPIIKDHFGFQKNLHLFEDNITLLTSGKLISNYIRNHLNADINIETLGSIKSTQTTVTQPTITNKILLAPEGTMTTTLEYLNLANQLAERLPNIIFTLRVHPSLFRYQKKKICNGVSQSNVEISNQSLVEDLKESTYCVYTGSAVGIEACLHNVMPIYFRIHGLNLDPLGICNSEHEHAYSVKELVDKLNEYLDSKPNFTALKNECSEYFEPINHELLNQLTS